MKTRYCEGCHNKTLASGPFCRTCRSKAFHANKRIKDEGLIVDTVLGQDRDPQGAYWIWDSKGTVLVIGKPTKWQAIRALAFGDIQEEEEA